MCRTKPGTSSGTSQLVTYAISTVPGNAFKPARRPLQRTAALLLVAGHDHVRRQLGQRLPGAATTTMGETTVPSSRTTR